jgi:hypothetical protein
MSREIMQQVLCIIKLLRTHDNEQATEKLELISAFEKELAKREQELPTLRQVVIESALKGYGKPEPTPRQLQRFGDAPPRKEWVGLTNEELVEIRETHQAHIFQLMFAVEAKIREKNNAI